MNLEPLKKAAELSADVKNKILSAKDEAELDAVLAYIDELAEGEDLKEIFVYPRSLASLFTVVKRTKQCQHPQQMNE